MKFLFSQVFFRNLWFIENQKNVGERHFCNKERQQKFSDRFRYVQI